MFPPERTFHCDECGFDAGSLSDDDLVEATGKLARKYRAPLTRLLPGENGGEILRQRPAPGVWSALEYAAHVRDVLAFYRARIERVLAEHRPVLDGASLAEGDPASRDEDPGKVADAIAIEAETLSLRLDGLETEEWSAVGLSSDGSGAERTVRVLAERAVHEGQHHLLDIGRSLRAARQG